MSEPLDSSTEYLLEEYAMGRLHGEARDRVEAMLRAQPPLRSHVDALRNDKALLSGVLTGAASNTAGPVADATLALFIDGALDEMERASVEAALAGDVRLQARLAAMYRDTRAILDGEPFSGLSAAPVSSVISFVFPDPRKAGLSEAGALAISTALVLSSLALPAKFGIPVLFLSLGAFGWWATLHAFRCPTPPVRRKRLLFGLATSLVAFMAAPFAESVSIWCYVCSAAWYWYWLVHWWAPVPAVAVSKQGEAAEIPESRVSSGRG